MKTLKLVPLFLVAFLFCNYTATAQVDEDLEEIMEEDEVNEEENLPTIIIAVYSGIEDGAYTFTFKDEDGEENTKSFEKISKEAAKMFNLTTKTFIGKTFEITFSTDNVLDDEDIMSSIRTIISLKQI